MSSFKNSIKKQELANRIIQRRMTYAVGLGFIPIPIVDAASILTNQVLMIRNLAELYDVPFQEHRAESIIGALVSSLGTMGVVKAIPGFGTLAGGLAMSLGAAAATYGLVKVFMLHFNQGGTLLDFDTIKSREYFQELYEEGKLKAKKLRKELEKDETKDTASDIPNKKNIRKKASRKTIRVKRRKRRIRMIWIGLYIGLILVLLAILFSKFGRGGEDEELRQLTHEDLVAKTDKGGYKDLEIDENFIAENNGSELEFDYVSTENVIERYIQSDHATYPQLFVLDAVSFNGISTKIGDGAEKQLKHIALLMKKYPDLLVDIYGQTMNVGPKFTRQRIGRERARVLKNVLISQGIAPSRITANEIEKHQGRHDEYWGAEMLIKVATNSHSIQINKNTENILGNDFLENSTGRIQDNVIPEDNNNLYDTTTNIQNDTSINSNSTDSNIVIIDTTNNIVSNTESFTNAIAQYLKTYPNPVYYPKSFLLSGVLFLRENTQIGETGKTKLRELTQLMNRYPSMTISIYAYVPSNTDGLSAGERQSFLNKWRTIGNQRAQLIKQELINDGVATERIIKARYRFTNKKETELYWQTDVDVESR